MNTPVHPEPVRLPVKEYKPNAWAKSVRRRLLLFAVFAVVLSGILVAASLAYSRTRAIQSGEAFTDSFAQVIAEQTNRTFQSIDLRLQLAADSLEHVEESGLLFPQAARSILQGEMKDMPFVLALEVTDLKGQVVYSTGAGKPGRILSNLPHFQVHQTDPKFGFYIASPARDKVTQKWVLPTSRAIVMKGKFSGVIVAEIDPAYFGKLWGSLDLGSAGSIALFRRDATLIMRSPMDDSAMGKNFQNRPLFTERLLKNKVGRYLDVSPIDDIRRQYSYRTVGTQPELVILLGQSIDQILSPWRFLVGLSSSIWLMGCAALISMCVFLDRAWRRQLRTDAQLRQSEENLSITLDSIGDAVIATDEAGLITRMNPTAEQLTGVKLGAALGRPLSEVFRIINAQTREKSVNPVDLVMAKGEVVGLANHTALLSHDGSEYQIFDSAAPIRDSGGQVVGVVLVFSDVTEDYRLRESLASKVEMLQRTGEMASVGGWELNLQTRRFSYSPEALRINHLTHADATYESSIELALSHFAPESRSTLQSAIQEAIDNGTPFDLELPKITQTGSEIWVRTQGTRVSENGRPAKLVGALQDITSSKHADAALRKSEASLAASQASAHLGSWDFDMITLKSTWSAENFRLYGLDPADGPPSFTEFLELLHPDDRQKFVDYRGKSTTTEGEYSQEFRTNPKDGKVKTYLNAFRAVRGPDGKVARLVGTTLDITERKQAEQKLMASQAALVETALHTQTILDNMVDGVITLDSNGRVASFNKAATDIFGHPPENVVGRDVAMLMAKSYQNNSDIYFRGDQAPGEPRALRTLREVDGQRQDGSVFPMSIAMSRVERTGNTTYIAIVRDITQQRKDVEEIRRLAFYDPLTGLPNRRLLMDRLRQAMLTSQRAGQHGALMFLDLDHFKLLNDTMGHDVGDVLLQQVAARLLACVREGDSVARLGGDEFVVLLEALSPHNPDAATQAESVAAKILEAFKPPFNLRGLNHPNTPSIGIMVFMGDDVGMEELLKKADVAMYQAKAAGRNTARFFDPATQAAVEAHEALEKDLRRGLLQQEFVVHYQIQVNGQGLPVGTEALVRWQHPQRGLITPAHFIPMAEATGMILPLGQWVLETACTQLVTWAASPQSAQWTVAVNVSASQFAQPDFVASVTRALEKTGANPRLLKLELTESMLLNDIEEVIVKMNQIKALGAGFSLDDFGTGYSSLSYIKRLPLEQLKIDQSFVRDVLTDPSDAVIARTILALGHSLGLKVIAEGVETTDQRDCLAAMGCDAFQGYLFGRPGPVEQVGT